MKPLDYVSAGALVVASLSLAAFVLLVWLTELGVVP